MTGSTKHVMAVASGGGHWDELICLRNAFDDCRITYVTTMSGLGKRSGVDTMLVPDCNRDTKWAIIRCAVGLLLIMLRCRPHVIVTTGALPGLVAIMLGKFFGIRSLWIDSVANAQDMSMSGQKARRWADECLSQWPEVAKANNVSYRGAVL